MKNKGSWSISLRIALIIIVFTLVSAVTLGLEVYQRKSAELYQQKCAQLVDTANRFNFILNKYFHRLTQICDYPYLNSVEKIDRTNRLLQLPTKNLIAGTEIKLGYCFHDFGDYAGLISEEKGYKPMIIEEPGLVTRLRTLPGEPPVGGRLFTVDDWEIYHVCPICLRGKILGEIFTSLPADSRAVQLVAALPRILQKVWPLLLLGFISAFYVLKTGHLYLDLLNRNLQALERAYQQHKGLPPLKENLPVEYYEPYERYRELAQHSQELVREVSASFRMASTGEMIVAMAHDIRNPLAVIRASAELGKVSGDHRERDVLLGNIIAAGETIDKYLDHYLNLSRYPRDIKEAIKLNEIYKSLLPVVKPMGSLKGIRLEATAAEGSGELKIYGDRMALSQAFLNLFSNAIEATPEGGLVKASVHLEKGVVVITLADSGYGIPEANRHRVFDHFFTTKGRRGVGLGLALVKRVIDNHGGEIWFESVLGKGTTFFVKLPLAGEVLPATGADYLEDGDSKKPRD